jgi:HD-GYP domain-containing protein (c-di-GMP phosphodiesterase class II)/two-component sensor histidine kinase
MSKDAVPERDFERLKASLVSLISHELRTPLTYISASLEMLEIAYENPGMDAEVNRFLNIIDQGVKQLNSTIDELLLFSSLESDPKAKEVQPQPDVDVQQLVVEVLNILKPTYQAKKQVLEVSIQDDLPLLRMDASKLSEIVLQLLSNAIKFTPAKGHIRVLVMRADTWLHMVVSDTGPGIAPELRERIFDPFYQKEDYLIREHGGLGLGLTLVQRLCHAIGARLEVFPEEGMYTGTNFQVRLPLQLPTYEQGPELKKALEQMQQLSLSNAEKEAQLHSLKSQLIRYTEDLQRASQSNDQKQSALDTIYLEMMSGFAAALEVRDPFTRGRSQRIASYASLLADEAGLSVEEQARLQQACLLCDIGYIGISDAVLHKEKDRLSDEELAHIHSHPRIAAEMLKHIHSFEPVVPLILYHHENFDGSGYPEGLSGDKIPYLSRLMRVVDAFDAMISERSYRKRFAPDYALQEIHRFAGSQFDPEIVKLFTRLWDSGRLQSLIASLEPKVNPKDKTKERRAG